MKFKGTKIKSGVKGLFECGIRSLLVDLFVGLDCSNCGLGVLGFLGVLSNVNPRRFDLFGKGAVTDLGKPVLRGINEGLSTALNLFLGLFGNTLDICAEACCLCIATNLCSINSSVPALKEAFVVLIAGPFQVKVIGLLTALSDLVLSAFFPFGDSFSLEGILMFLSRIQHKIVYTEVIRLANLNKENQI